MTPRIAWLRTLTLLAVVVVAQVTILDVIAGRLIRVDAPLLLLVAMAFRARPDELSVVAFAAGVGIDLFHAGPFGQHAVAYVTIGIVSATIVGRAGLRPSILTRTTTAVAAVVVGWAVLGAANSLVFASVPIASLVGAGVGVHLALHVVGRTGLVTNGATRAIGRAVDSAHHRRPWSPVQ